MLRDMEEFQRVRGDRSADRKREPFCPSRCEAGYTSGREAATPGRFDEQRRRGQLAASGWGAVPALPGGRDRLALAEPAPNRPDAPRDLLGLEGSLAASRELASGPGRLGNAARGRSGSS